jgi:hypothetical protein
MEIVELLEQLIGWLPGQIRKLVGGADAIRAVTARARAGERRCPF